MEVKKKELRSWIKRHRKELIIAGLSVAAIFTLVIGIKKRESLIDLWESLQKIIMNNRPSADYSDGSEIIVKAGAVTDTIEMSDLVIIDTEGLARLPHDVRAHLRVLPLGQQASADKIATASENGFDITSGGITWVKNYSTGLVA